MADVFVGCIKGEAGFERAVAVKRMASNLAEDAEFVSMFLEEAKLAARIRSAHVVQTLDLGRGADGVPYLIMDLVVGASVARVMKSAARQTLEIPLGVALTILMDACRGLHDAHEAKRRDGTPLGMVHRDVVTSQHLGRRGWAQQGRGLWHRAGARHVGRGIARRSQGQGVVLLSGAGARGLASIAGRTCSPLAWLRGSCLLASASLARTLR